MTTGRCQTRCAPCTSTPSSSTRTAEPGRRAERLRSRLGERRACPHAQRGLRKTPAMPNIRKTTRDDLRQQRTGTHRMTTQVAERYRLVTRSDFDGLVCAALLKEL